MDIAKDLFEDSTLLAWLPGETLFSLISRHHFMSGQLLAATTCSQFFGHHRAGSQHDIPSRLKNFVRRTNGRLGGVETVATTRTLLAYYAAFISTGELQDAIASMAGDSVAHLKLRLGLVTSRFRANHPLKSCETCMAEDRAEFGWAYWHMNHQFPGIWICQKHGQLLRESNQKATGVGRFLWHLPAAEHGREWVALCQKDQLEAFKALRSLSELTNELVAVPTNRTIDKSRLYQVYRAELERRHWISGGGNLRMPTIAASFAIHVQYLRFVPELQALPATAAEAANQLGRLLRTPRSGTHPLRHVVLINWLFGSAKAFWQAYDEQLGQSAEMTGSTGAVFQLAAEEAKDPRRDQLLNMLTEQKLSAHRAAKNVGIDVGTAMSWAAQAGFTVSRRPKKLSGERRRQAIIELQSGLDKSVVAANVKVSVVTITKLLLSEVGLHTQWCNTRELAARNGARGVWLQMLQSYQGVGIKYLRAMEPATYAWLYRHDRNWLNGHKPTRRDQQVRGGGLRVLWDARDQTLSVEVAQAVQNLQTGSKVRQIKLWQIYQAVPELKAKLAALSRLPMTRRVIDKATQRHSANQETPNLFD